ncbi:hypothetical protein EDB19DRAFT_1833142 [Suillus lakei]|nr:hypothetical protein EDB19DRAFT_1833142 [Suillus lakei]
MDYDLCISPQTTLSCASRKGKERETSPKRLAGPSQKKPAKYIAVRMKGEENKGCRISKNEYKKLTEWCVGVHKQLPGGDIFYAYEYDAADEDDTAPVGPIISAKDMVANEVRMAALLREEPSTFPDTVVAPAAVTQGITSAEFETSLEVAVTQGVTSAESETSPEVAVTQGVTSTESKTSLEVAVTQGVMSAESETSPEVAVAVTQSVTIPRPVNDEPAQVTVTLPVAKAIEDPVAPQRKEKFPSYMALLSPLGYHKMITSHQCFLHPGSFHLPQMRGRFSQRQWIDLRLSLTSFKAKITKTSFTRAMPQLSSPPLLGAVLSKPTGRLMLESRQGGASNTSMNGRVVYFMGRSHRDDGSSWHERSYFKDSYQVYERRTSCPYQEEGYRPHHTQAHSRHSHRPAYYEAYSSCGGSSSSYMCPPTSLASSYWPSLASIHPPSPRCEEYLAFSSDCPFVKRKFFSSQLEFPGHTGENQRFCPEDREVHQPTLSYRITDDISMGPSPLSSRSLTDRVHTVAKVPRAEQKLKKNQVLNLHAEQVPTLMLKPSMSQVFLQPQALVSADEGIQLITQAYRANELRINGPHVFMQGIAFPAAPVHHSGRLIMTFRCGAPFRVISSIQYAAPTQLEVRPWYLATKGAHVGIDLCELGYWNTYEATIQQLLNQPFVRHFLMVGGIIWHIALQFGPNTLVQQALAGPSSDITRWKSGEVLDDLWDHTVTPAGMVILLGQGLDKVGTCWPPHDIWTSSAKWSGFWSEEDESWFQLQLANLSSGNINAPKTHKDWKRFYRPIPDSKSDDPSIHGSEAFARDLFQSLGYCVDHDPTWNLDT